MIVVLVHEGVSNAGDINNPKCDGVSGALLAIIDRLDPAVDVVVSGHTHQAYVCDYGNINRARPVLLTSAGSRGQIVTGIDLKIDPASKKLLIQRRAQSGGAERGLYRFARSHPAG